MPAWCSTTRNGMSKTINIETFEAWANITMEIWQDRMMKYQVRDSGALFSSLKQHVNAQANGSSDRIDFFFLYYGIFVDMGVGGEFKRGNSGDTGYDYGLSSPKRQAKPWYSKAFYGQVKRLGEIVAEKYGDAASQQIVGFMTSQADDRISQYRHASNERSMRNYRRRRAEAGRWVNQHKQWKIGFTLENHNFSK